MADLENGVSYHEIDFLLPTQRFNINFSYVTKKGLPFVREYILRLVHLAPMSKAQISAFFGFSRREADEAVMDLVDRGELTLSESGQLMLTEKSKGYFSEIGEVPRLSLLRDAGTCLVFDLATFTCLGKDIPSEKWRTGVPLKVEDTHAANSEALVEKHFQRQFNKILNKGFLSKSIVDEEGESPSIYTVNSVSKIRQMPFRLPVHFRIDGNGRRVELEDIEQLASSDYVHEQIAVELNRLSRPRNFLEIVRAMGEIDDRDTIKVFDPKTEALDLHFFFDLTRLEENQGKRTTFVGPIYSAANWGVLQRHLAPVLARRIQGKSDPDKRGFLWLAPSDPYWGKSSRLQIALGDFVSKAATKDKKIYSPAIYLPISGQADVRSARTWKQELEQYVSSAHGLMEGLLGGGVEILLFERELVAVVYHVSMPELYRVTLPLGFISTDKEVVAKVGHMVDAYIKGSSGYDIPNDCGPLAQLGQATAIRG